MSDLHLEVEKYKTNDIKLIPHNECNADVLVLAGDIYKPCIFFYNWINEVKKYYPEVLYIPGNHEYYNQSRISKVNTELEDWLGSSFLHNKVRRIGDFNFIGSTLWSDLDEHPDARDYAVRYINDFRVIRYDDHILLAQNYVDMFKENVNFINDKLTLYDNVIVVTHHTPSWSSVHPKYMMDKSSRILNHVFTTDLEYLMWPNVKVWIHGHTHDSFDYYVNNTRVVCNPRGYYGTKDQNPYFSEHKYIDVI